MSRDLLRHAARSGFYVFCSSAALMLACLIAYAAGGWISASVYVFAVLVLLGVSTTAVAAALPWVVSVVADAVRDRGDRS